MEHTISDHSLRKQAVEYFKEFNLLDEECYRQDVDNEHACAWLLNNIPLFDCPDKELEKTYYFRWWTFRKHIKSTPKGKIITEFLPPVYWAGPFNSINCASGFHIREGRWLRNSRDTLRNYIDFWLGNDGNSHSYSAWWSWAIWEYCTVSGDMEFGILRLDQMAADYHRWEEEHLGENGLFWSIDDRDGMECSISGSGYRPTINSYMYGNAKAIAAFAALAGRSDLEKTFTEKAQRLKENIQAYLWQQDFFRTIPLNIDDQGGLSIPSPEECMERNVRELVGYVPWYFDLPAEEFGEAFHFLFEKEHFLGEAGLRTADKESPRLNYPVDHECLWNGPSWPFATGQTLVALSNYMEQYPGKIRNEDYYYLLRQYALQHRLRYEDGREQFWIDENLDPEAGHWIARTILKDWGWKPEFGGYERGKDYNHSLFCDLVISGLVGVQAAPSGTVTVHPKVPDTWTHFALTDLDAAGSLWDIYYDMDGTHYGKGTGLIILKKDTIA